jgi:hypothetical protein
MAPDGHGTGWHKHDVRSTCAHVGTNEANEGDRYWRASDGTRLLKLLRADTICD